MKNLANCTPREFLKQTAKIRHAVEKWLTITDIMNIRKRVPDIPNGTSEAEKRQLLIKQSKDNIRVILDSIMEEHPDETCELLALLCFVEPADVDSHPMSDYLGAISEMVENEDVLRFFISLAKVARQFGLTE